MKGAMVNGVEAGPVGAEIRDGVCRSGIVDEEAVFSSFSVIQPQDVAASRVPKPGTVPVLLSWIGHVAIAPFTITQASITAQAGGTTKGMFAAVSCSKVALHDITCPVTRASSISITVWAKASAAMGTSREPPYSWMRTTSISACHQAHPASAQVKMGPTWDATSPCCQNG